MQAVIMAGGKGTRIASIVGDIPKPLIQIGGKPILLHQIECLKKQGFKDIIITVSHMADKIINYFRDGSSYGVNIKYFIEETPMGNAGALFKLKGSLEDEFLLINGDQLFNIDISRFVRFHHQKGGLASILTHPNSHPYDSGLIFTDSNSKVVKWINKEDERPEWYKNRVNAGFHFLSKKILELVQEKDKVDLDRDILKPLCNLGLIYAYDSPEYIKDMGTPERYYQVTSDYKNGIISRKSLNNKQYAVFLDRDGTINKYAGFLRNIDDFELIDGVAEAIKTINNNGYLAIVVTNQPVIARGETSLEELDEIHMKLETLLGKKGAYIDALYFCPHHPHKGYPGERVEYKIECNCRKPKPGMLIKAAEEYNIDLGKSWIIGDDDNDVKAGINAGVKPIKIGENEKYKTLLEAVNNIFKGE